MTRMNFNMRMRTGEHTGPVTLNELEGHLSVSEVFKCKSSTFCVALYTLHDFNWQARIARSLSDSWASCKLRIKPKLRLKLLIRRESHEWKITSPTVYILVICHDSNIDVVNYRPSSVGGNTIASVYPSVRPFVSTLSSEPTDVELLHVSRLW